MNNTCFPHFIRIGVIFSALLLSVSVIFSQDSTASVSLSEMIADSAVEEPTLPASTSVEEEKTLEAEEEPFSETIDSLETAENPTQESEKPVISESLDSAAVEIAHQDSSAASQESLEDLDTANTVAQATASPDESSTESTEKTAKEIPEEKEKRFVEFSLKAIDSTNHKPLRAHIRLYTINDNGSISRGNGLCDKYGNFELYMTNDSHFKVLVTADGYRPFRAEYNFKKNKDIEDLFEVKAQLNRFKVGDKMLLEAVHFQENKSKILKESYEELDQLVTILKNNEKMHIQLNGHTDINGSKSSNLDLSLERVKAVRWYLVQKGIKASRIKTKGFGGSQPLTHQRDAESKKANRRVEFEILKI